MMRSIGGADAGGIADDAVTRAAPTNTYQNIDRRSQYIVESSLKPRVLRWYAPSTSARKGRKVILTETPAQSGRPDHANLKTGAQPGVRCPRTEL
jgi:hypothetical protein